MVLRPLHHANIEHFAGQQSAVVAMILPTVLNLILDLSSAASWCWE